MMECMKQCSRATRKETRSDAGDGVLNCRPSLPVSFSGRRAKNCAWLPASDRAFLGFDRSWLAYRLFAGISGVFARLAPAATSVDHLSACRCLAALTFGSPEVPLLLDLDLQAGIPIPTSSKSNQPSSLLPRLSPTDHPTDLPLPPAHHCSDSFSRSCQQLTLAHLSLLLATFFFEHIFKPWRGGQQAPATAQGAAFTSFPFNLPKIP